MLPSVLRPTLGSRYLSLSLSGSKIYLRKIPNQLESLLPPQPLTNRFEHSILGDFSQPSIRSTSNRYFSTHHYPQRPSPSPARHQPPKPRSVGFFKLLGSALFGYVVAKSLLDYKTAKSKVDQLSSQTDTPIHFTLSPSDFPAFFLTSWARSFSRAWGSLCSLEIPRPMRSIIYSAWGKIFGSNMEEIEHDLNSFPTFQDFFVRTLKPGSRYISDSSLVSPCDGQVLYFGDVDTNNWTLEQVKGVPYSLPDFCNLLQSQLQDRLSQFKSKSASLKYIILYLGPGDYHRVHSPTQFFSDSVSHTPGHLLTVNPLAARFLTQMYAVNERIVWNGSWNPSQNSQEDYFFSMSMVGAYNVGSIVIEGVKMPETNTPELDTAASVVVGLGGQFSPLVRFATDGSHTYNPGDLVGKFHLGSSVVLVFEAPLGASFSDSIQPNSKIQVGDPLLII